jgi:hypothetical protein
MVLQLSIIGCVVVDLLFRFGKEVIIMETFLEILREVLKGIAGSMRLYLSEKRSRKQENHPTPSQQKGGSQK